MDATIRKKMKKLEIFENLDFIKKILKGRYEKLWQSLALPKTNIQESLILWIEILHFLQDDREIRFCNTLQK